MIGIPIASCDRYVLIFCSFHDSSIDMLDKSPIMNDRETYQGGKPMYQQQIVDVDTGDVISSKQIPENRDFVMIFRKGFVPLRDLGKKDPKARVLLDLFLEHMDPTNALIVSRETISELLGWSVPTIDRKIKFLKENQFLDVLKSGTSSVYVVNAEIAWTTWGNKRQYAKFKANVLVSATEQNMTKFHKTKQLELIS